MGNNRICEIDSCGKTHKGFGFCSHHYKRFKRYGDPLGAPQEHVDIGCTVKGCDQRHYGKGFCHKHYQRLKKFGKANAPVRYRPPKGEQRYCTVNGCETSHAGQGFCSMHYWRFRRGGDMTQPKRLIASHGDPAKWLDHHVNHNGDACLTWPFRHGNKGYGSIKFLGESMSPSRAMCIMAHGKPRQGKNISAHSCGNGHRGCVNPKHLRWATEQENRQDETVHRRLGIGRYAQTVK